MKLHSRFAGPADAPVLVLSSSLGTTHEMWDAQVAAFSAAHRVLRYDRRGHGRSPVPRGPYSIDDLGNDVLELLDELTVERVTFCGLSLGGCEAMWLAANAPERVERLVLCCTDPWFGAPEPWQERAATVRAEGVAAIAEAALGRWFTPAFHAEHPDAVERFRAMLTGTPVEGYAACCEAIAGLDLRPDLARVVAPTLVVTGAGDPSVTAEAGKALAAAIGAVRHVTLDACAHLANVEQPGAFDEAVLGFVTAAIEEARA